MPLRKPARRSISMAQMPVLPRTSGGRPSRVTMFVSRPPCVLRPRPIMPPRPATRGRRGKYCHFDPPLFCHFERRSREKSSRLVKGFSSLRSSKRQPLVIPAIGGNLRRFPLQTQILPFRIHTFHKIILLLPPPFLDLLLSGNGRVDV